MHLAVINGSPRLKKNSNTDKIIQSFLKSYTKEGNTFELWTLSDRKEWEGAKKAYLDNTMVLIALPLYVENVPGILLEFLEGIPEKENSDTTLSFILQGGFAEGCQLRCGEEFLEMIASKLGCKYGGTLVKGDNFGIRLVDEEAAVKMTGQYEKMGELFAKDHNFFSDEARRFAGPEQFSKGMQILYGIIFKLFSGKLFGKAARSWGCTEPLDAKPWAQERK